MDEQTAHRLNEINRAFYAQTAPDFHATRGRAWIGWQRLIPRLRAPLQVLDIGCGNGRFGVFLAEQSLKSLTYHGIDNSGALLDYAGSALDGLPGVSTNLELRDVVDAPLPDSAYDLVVLFGVLHHVPGAERRQRLVRSAAERLAPGGLLVFACWRFYEYPRFRERIVPWAADDAVETNDYLLDWRRGSTALRYCHYVDDAEHAALVAASGLIEIERYRADGETGDVNQYSVLKQAAD
ncbi:MAG: methyltransferase domain-containing protein [Anaerolineae bacterium]|nr:methyltransferase domain-containing protein [Anaerolineae bacterium]